MFESLSDRFYGIFKRLRGRGRLGEREVDEVLREIRLALLEADVNFRVVKDVVARIKEQCIGADLQRPAAVEQLRVLGAQIDVPVFSEPSDPVAVAASGLEEAQRLGRDVLICDTAGRLHVDADLMDEVRRVSEAIQPDYTFLV